nr:RES family NAD+ phosphorylase [Stenotrophomonas pavanii]
MTKHVCINCITPERLKSLAASNSSTGKCAFCKGKGTGISAPILYDYLWARIRENTVSVNQLSDYEQAMIYECGADDVQMATIDVVVAEWLGLGEESYLEDALAHLPSDLRFDDHGQQRHFFMDEGNLERNPYDDKWLDFVKGISHVHRFFNSEATSFLDAIFFDLLDMKGRVHESRLLTLKPGIALFRARKVDGREKAELLESNPSSQFGSTPPYLAGSQRMTPNGISALYCALDRETCLSEIRSITGDNVVSIALTPTSPMIFLDISRLGLDHIADRDMLDEGYLDQVQRRSFIRSLVTKMSRPKRTGDELTYLSTQVVFEYLRIKLAKTAHGIAFPSVQTGSKGVNVAVFPEYCSITSPRQPVKRSVKKPLDKSAFLMALPESIVFHKITAITTSSTTYDSVEDMFMDELARSRLGDHATESWREADKKMQYVDLSKQQRKPTSPTLARFMRQKSN